VGRFNKRLRLLILSWKSTGEWERRVSGGGGGGGRRINGVVK
jgi:hypothetical protein